ncbi:MAG: hypothetical protein ACOCXA_07635, partial [Planctomycetota bacterium]
MARVTMADIARHLRLNQSTVSRALAGHPGIPQERRRQVLDCAEELGYQRDPGLSALARSRWQQRAPVYRVARISDYPSSEIRTYLRGHFPQRLVSRQARQLGLEISEHCLDGIADLPAYGQHLAETGVQGLLFGPLFRVRSLEELDWPWQRFALLAYDLWRERLPLPYVLKDEAEALHLCWQHLVAAGCRRIGLALQRRGRVREEEVLGRYLSLRRRRDLMPLHFRPEERPHRIRQWFRDQQPDGIIASHDGVYWDLLDAGHEIPGETRLVSMHVGDDRAQTAGASWQRQEVTVAIEHLHQALHARSAGLPEQPWVLRLSPQ